MRKIPFPLPFQILGRVKYDHEQKAIFCYPIGDRAHLILDLNTIKIRHLHEKMYGEIYRERFNRYIEELGEWVATAINNQIEQDRLNNKSNE